MTTEIIEFSNGMRICVNYPNSATLITTDGNKVTITRDGRDSLNNALNESIENVLRNSGGTVTVICDTRNN